MPILPNITLAKPYILVTKAESPSGLTPQTQGYWFGYVQMVYDTCDDLTVGQYVMFAPGNARAIFDGTSIYYIIDEAHKIFKETPV